MTKFLNLGLQQYFYVNYRSMFSFIKMFFSPFGEVALHFTYLQQESDEQPDSVPVRMIGMLFSNSTVNENLLGNVGFYLIPSHRL